MSKDEIFQKNARAKRAKILFFIVKYANLWGFCCRRRRGCLSSLKTDERRIVRLEELSTSVRLGQRTREGNWSR